MSIEKQKIRYIHIKNYLILKITELGSTEEVIKTNKSTAEMQFGLCKVN